MRHSAKQDERQRDGTSFIDLARATAVPIGRLSRSSATSLGSLGRAALAWCFDGGYDPKVASAARPEELNGTAIGLTDLSVRYGRPLALENLTGAFPAGSLTAVVGPNGAGKSTLLKALAGIVRTRRGAITAPSDRRRVAYLPQQTALDRGFPITVGEFVALGGWRRFGAFRSAPPEIARQVAEAIAAIGLEGLTGRQIADLSIGQFQRALFARILMQDADVLLLDEPFAAIDERTSEDLLRLLRRWHDEGRTVIAVLHDLAQVRAHFPVTLLLARRSVGWGETATTLTPENLARASAMLMHETGATGEAAE
jgi:zinc/manganese transport system ATP-binding protein